MIAIALLGACLAMMGFALVSLILPGSELIPDRPTVLDVVLFGTIFLSFPSVALVIAWKRPGNPVAWLFFAIGLAITMSVFASEYVGWVVYAGAQLPGSTIVAWLGQWAFTAAGTIFLPFSLMLFPEGRLPSRRWRAAAAVALALGLTSTIALAVMPGPIVGYEELENPFAVHGVIGEAAVALAPWEFGALGYSIVLAVAALAVRFRRGGAERQQVKWLLLPASVMVVFLIAGVASEGDGLWTVVILTLAAIPICAGIAILRYRLYDIDLVIRRTLVYALVIAVLGGAYVGLVLALTAALSSIVGGQALPVALSTLIIAALFGPVRARVRELIDRRFYRSRYDAQRTLESFSTRLRDEVELEAVGGALVDVAGRVVRPASADVWIRGRPA